MKRITVICFLILICGVLAISNAVASPIDRAVNRPQPQVVTPIGPSLPQVGGTVHALYFYANDCPHCLTIISEVIEPLQADYGDQLDIRLLEIGLPEYYEAMLTVEAFFEVAASERSIPALAIDSELLIGENEIKSKFPGLVAEGIESGGIDFPEINGLDPEILISVDPDPIEGEDDCETEENCAIEDPIFMAYFYQTGCKECSRVEADLNYLRTQYPQIQVVEFNIYDHADLAEWMTERVDPEGSFQSPALFIGDQVLFGDTILLENITPILEQYIASGTDPVWLDFDPEEGRQSIVERFENMGWLAVVAAGLVDGINPCAFATLIFFVSYLTLSGRKGKDVLMVGGAFSAGVFLAYLAVGFGLYQILELVGETLDVIARIVYLITAVFCLVLAVFSFIDYRRAKKGEVKDMLLTLPKPLRTRINATIRSGRNTRSYILSAFGAGLLISLLELACTGQVYLPTIIFVSSIPGLRLQALFYLVLYNLLFILPLVVIFVLVYYGTTSKDLTRFLQRRAAGVKFAMSIVFIALGGWLLVSLVF